MTFEDLLSKTYITRDFKRPKVLICLDPGETTGWSIFRRNKLVNCGQLDTSELGSISKELYGFISIHTAGVPVGDCLVVYENYRVYAHKSKQHINTGLHTPKLIGIIEAVCQLLSIPTHHQMAATAKPFCTDDKLVEWGFYQTGEKHANDSIRHGCYYLLFGGTSKHRR
ncbi:MAG: hypothetical protein LC687_00360 [Actinobacteria bacterium]|nr:hypothetical protein [Actinomycetota bacterium]MCA1806322.1 hypothetical protein [Actinomycetota bacterium]